jgi:RNA polymerase sigma-70 factor (ECF subfamily)
MVANALRKDRSSLHLVPSSPATAQASKERPPSARAFDDAELLAAVGRGDAASAAAFHDRVRPQVDRTVCRLLGRRDSDHEDVAQLAVIELIYTIDAYRGECSLDTWASTITAHIVYKHLRRRQTERRLFARMFDADELPVASPFRTSREAMGRSAVSRVAHHLDQLEPNQAWTFVLHDTMGYDLREIARITGVTVAAAQTRLIRGRRDLHERIAQDPDLANTLEEMERCP